MNEEILDTLQDEEIEEEAGQEEDLDIEEPEDETEDEAEDEANASGASEEELADDFSLEFRHDGELFEIGRDEAIKLAGMGKLYEANEEAFDTLNLISERMGVGPNDVLKNLLDTLDKDELESCIEEVGGDSFKGQKLFHERQKAARADYDKRKEERKANNDLKSFTEKKLAEEFLKYKDELGYKTVDDIPQEVINISMKEKISLFDAALRFNHSEQKKINKNKAKAAENAKRSAGSFETSGGKDDYSSHSSALLDA